MPDVEAKVLGLKQDVNDVVVASDNNPAGRRASEKNNLKRKETLSKSGKLAQEQVVGITTDGTAVTAKTDAKASDTTKVQAVGKEGSACCSIF